MLTPCCLVGLKANTKKQKYQRILERKQASCPELLCRGYPNEFREYFAHCSSLGFEDRPDYRYLKRILKELFEKQGYEDDGLYDWDAIKKQEEINDAGAGAGPVGVSAPVEQPEGQTFQSAGGEDLDGGGAGGDDDKTANKKSIISSIRLSLFGSKQKTFS